MSDSRNPPKRGRPKVRDSDRLSHVVQLRLNEVQRTYLLLLAESWDCSMGEAIRRVVDGHLDSSSFEIDGMEINGRPATLRESLAIVRPSAEWVEEHARKHRET